MDSMNEHSAADELAAAEAQLKAAQERLDAARQRMASEQSQQAAQPADASVDSRGAQSQPQPYAQAHQVSYAAQPAQPASFGSQPQPQQPTQPTAAWQPDAQQAQGQPYATQAGAQQSAQPYAAPQGSAYAQPQAQAAQQPYGAQPGYGSVPPQNPYGQQAQYGYQQPYVAPTVGEKDHVAAGLLALFLGWLGVHKFYLGYNTSGFIMLGTSILGGILTLSVASWAIWVIAIVEGIFYLSKSQSEFEQMYVINKREWF
ncbi:TM2 domain-containing protein [Senegalimassilia anaerobia]|uniref:TM2 domain-containing protein n=1 Tax=Senegalimassilia anaerobia TaxID=1473216 RepID=UPI0026E96D5F|nr:TM2 domain-containing protein [Senegalimassilia anaerobia]